MNSLNCSLLVHTFNRYQFLWDGFLAGSRHIKEEIPMYFGTDTPEHERRDFRKFSVLYSGEGEWADRLIKLIRQIKTDYIFYIQEDMWPVASPPPLQQMMNMIHSEGLLRLQISPVIQFYQLHGSKLPLHFYTKSKYMVNHQPSIWQREFLLSCLRKGEDPWKNEYEGTKRLNHQPEYIHKIAIYPHDWFVHKCEKGILIN